MNDLSTIKEYLEEEVKKTKDETMEYLYYNFRAEEGEENKHNTLNFLVGEYSSLVNTLKKVENLISEKSENGNERSM